MVTLEFTPEEAAMFLRYKEREELFTVLEASGVFNIRNGKAILNFNPEGTLTDITGDIKLYQRGIEVIPILVDLHNIQ